MAFKITKIENSLNKKKETPEVQRIGNLSQIIAGYKQDNTPLLELYKGESGVPERIYLDGEKMKADYDIALDLLRRVRIAR